ncbi:MAG TPA: metal-dependent hydrolase [Terrimesophilobacter sp.]|nr:metal-dependent hydrolase [Terrimesophilobacter sp.]HRP99598.1 metal-dependent hydrolase [Terrimesophilobacter sp.]
MTFPSNDTLVTYPAGETESTATVVHVERLSPTRFAVLLDQTPCHPVDAGWPDQGPDRATLSWEEGTFSVTGCVVGATDGAQLFIGADVPVRKGAEGWAFVVVHVLADAPTEGTEVTVTVDADNRAAISTGHTGCHLASLALNRALASRWSKEIGADALGFPNFDAEANESSTILERGSRDSYRIGKSLRKRGFVVEGLAEELAAIEASVNEFLAGWIAEDAPVRVDRDGERLTDRRYWVCSLAEGEARIACGGTHAQSLGELGALRATLTLSEAPGALELTMVTAA